jgi:hypothetical protein
MAEFTPLDWQALADRLGSIAIGDGQARTEGDGTDLARAAIELLLTRECLAGAVDHYISFKPGFELARSI